MNLKAPGALRILGSLELEPFSEFHAPFDTATIVIDYPRGVMEIFTEPEVHPLDWDIICGLVSKLADIPDLGEPDYLKGINTWHIQLKPTL